MRIKSNLSEIKPNCSGKVTLIMDTVDDLWHFYNILYKGDLIQTKTTRKVTHENKGGKKSVKKEHIFITLKVDSIEYDAEGSEIRVNGKNVSESEYLSLGQFQSATLKTGEIFSIIKRVWDSFTIEKLEIASNPSSTSDLAVCLMEEGSANIFLVSSHITICKAKVEHSIPKKRKGATQHDKGMEIFFGYVLDSIIQNINFDIVKCLVIGSPGFVKDEFSTFVNEKLSGNSKECEILKKNFKKLFYTHVSSCYQIALNELFSNNDVLNKITNTKASEDILYMNKFDKTLALDYEKIVFGMKQINIGIDNKAIDYLIVTDNYLRKIGPNNRKALQKKFIDIEKFGGEVKQFSSMHPTGKRIDNLGGITGVVKFDIPELHETEIQEEIENNEDSQKESESSSNIYDELKDLIGTNSEITSNTDDLEGEFDKLGFSKPTKSELKERELEKKLSIDRKLSHIDDDDDLI